MNRFAILETLYRITSRPGWRWLHQVFPPIYRWFIPKLLVHISRWQCGLGEVLYVPRHSVVNPKDYFNLFASDIDLTLILSSDRAATQSRVLYSRYQTWRKWLWMLGELEIYTEREWKTRLALETQNSAWFEFLRGLRKIRWQEEAYRFAKSPYHQQKALQAIQRILNSQFNSEPAQPKANLLRLGPQVAERIASLSQYRAPSDSKDFSIYCQYLDAWLTKSPSGRANEIYLPSQASAVALLATIPHWPNPDLALTQEIKAALRHPGLARLSYLTLHWEEIVYRSVMRTSHTISPPMLEYARFLDLHTQDRPDMKAQGESPAHEKQNTELTHDSRKYTFFGLPKSESSACRSRSTV